MPCSLPTPCTPLAPLSSLSCLRLASLLTTQPRLNSKQCTSRMNCSAFNQMIRESLGPESKCVRGERRRWRWTPHASVRGRRRTALWRVTTWSGRGVCARAPLLFVVVVVVVVLLPPPFSPSVSFSFVSFSFFSLCLSVCFVAVGVSPCSDRILHTFIFTFPPDEAYSGSILKDPKYFVFLNSIQSGSIMSDACSSF